MVIQHPSSRRDWRALMRAPNQFNPVIWLVGTSFVLLQFFLQLSSGVIINVIMHDMHLTALAGGLLSGSFYVF